MRSPQRGATLCRILLPSVVVMTVGVQAHAQSSQPSHTYRRVEIAAALALYAPTERDRVPLTSDLARMPMDVEAAFGGVLVAVAANLNPHVSLVGELSYFEGIAYVADGAGPSFMAGPRVVVRRAWPLPLWLGGEDSALGAFGQVLAGANGVGDRSGGAAIQPGAGLVWSASGHASLFLEIDGVFVRGGGTYGPGARVAVGAIFGH